MSMARILVFFLRLSSLGGILFSGILMACPFLMPGEIPSSAAGVASPGCISSCFAVVLLPLSLMPAVVAWLIQEKSVKPQQIAERNWRDAAISREERLGTWIRYLADLLVRYRRLRNTHDDPVPLVLQSEIPRALREFDPRRQARLLRFLREADLAGIREMDNHSAESETNYVEGEMRLPRRGLVFLAAGVFALLSGFFLLWAGLVLLTILFANPLQSVGLSDGRMGDLIPALCALLTPALVCGLASAGLTRMYRQAVRSLQGSEGDREIIQRTALKSIQDQVEGLTRLSNGGDLEEALLTRKIIQAMVVATASELDGLHRAKLVLLLYDSGWLRGDRAVSTEGFNLRAAELGGASLSEVCLSGADLSGADLNGANLTGADLHRCALCGSDLQSACLVGANLLGADLRYSRLQRANLEGADLRSTLIENANFWGASLVGTELSDARGNAEFLATASESA